MSDYTLADYVGMLGDHARMEAYTRALRRHVRPGHVVVDLGAGPGVFALFAARLGARVHAIDPNEAVLALDELASASGLRERVVIHHADSRAVDLGEPADLVVADIRGTLPLLGPGLSCVVDARRRFLRPGGVLLPERDVLRAAPLRDPSLLDKHARPWRGADWAEGLTLEPLARFASSTWVRSSLHAPQLLCPPATLAEIPYRTLETEHLRGQATWTPAEQSRICGFAVWFDAVIDGDLGYSNAPLGLPPTDGAGRADSVYGTAFFPLGDELVIPAGRALGLTVLTTPTGDDHTWTWRVELDGRVVDEQSTFFSGLLGRASLERRAETFRPEPSERARADAEALGRFGGGETLGEIARALAERHPSLFPTYARALDHVGELSARISRRTP